MSRFFISVLFALSACVSRPTMAQAQAGHPVLQEVLKHYSADADSLARAAAEFLFDNMDDHGYVTFDLADSSGNVIPFDVLSFPTYEALEDTFRVLERRFGTLDFKKRTMVDDDSVITADFVIDHIDHALMAWMTRPWAKNFDFAQFCEYILPYRGSNEPLEKWRGYFATRYDSAFAVMKNPADPIEAAAVINREMMSWFHFDPRFYYHPTDQGLTDMLSTTLGRCEDMTNLTIFAMRANGLAVTSDFTPYWANSGNNHAWNAIVTTEGKVVPFMGAEANPGEYRLANKLAKVYRKTFSTQRQCLAFQFPEGTDLPKYLSSKNIVDVTRDYADVRDVSLNLTAPDSARVAYLCVFNSGEWKAICWSTMIGSSVTFKDVGVGIAYVPAVFASGEIVPAGPAFVLNADGSRSNLIAEKSTSIDLEVASTTKKTLEISTDGVAKTYLTPGAKYTLQVWRDGWETVATADADEKPLHFSNVPANGLYWLTEEDSDREERIFTSDGKTQIWW